MKILVCDGCNVHSSKDVEIREVYVGRGGNHAQAIKRQAVSYDLCNMWALRDFCDPLTWDHDFKAIRTAAEKKAEKCDHDAPDL